MQYFSVLNKRPGSLFKEMEKLNKAKLEFYLQYGHFI